MNDPEFMEFIIREVMRRIAKPEKKSLVLFTGGTAGFEKAYSQVKKLKGDGWSIDILFTAGAEKLYSKEYLQRKFEDFNLYFESRLSSSQNFKDIQLILIPVLTVNTAVKIALGIADTPATHLASSALINGIPIIAAKDACNPRNYKMDHSRSTKASEAYANKVEGYMKTLGEYGVTLVSSGALCEAVREIRGDKERRAADSIKKKIITKEDVIKAQKDGSMKIIINETTKVTAYAEEIAGELGVEILCI